MNKGNHETGAADEAFWWRPAAWLRVSGEDALNFLQGQFTNDLREPGGAGAVYGLWLNHKGRVLADSFVVRGREGEFWVGSYFSSVAAIRERLENFIVADDVTVEDATANWRGVTWWGTEREDGGRAPDGDFFCLPGRRMAEANREWVFPAGREAVMRERFAGAREVDAAEMKRRRIAAGIPAVPADIGPGELPNEGGLETAAISYTKGCYLGQEVMARLKTMGRVRRRLLRVRGNGPVPAAPVALVQGGRGVGELRTVAAEGDGFVGLALVSLPNLRADAPPSLATGGLLTMIDRP